MKKRQGPMRKKPILPALRPRDPIHPPPTRQRSPVLPRDRVPTIEDLIGSRLNELSPSARKRLEEASAALRRVMEEVLPTDAGFETYEQTVLEISNEIARQTLERKLQTTADAFAPMLRIDHNNDWHGFREGTAFEFRRHLRGTVAYHSLVGDLRVARDTYVERNPDGRSSYVPLELTEGLIERMTPCLAKAVAYGYAQMPSREFTTLLRYAGRAVPSRSTLERCADDVGTYARTTSPIIMPCVRAQEQVPNGAVTLVLGLDRTSVALRNDDGGIHDFFVHEPRFPRPKAWHPQPPQPGTAYRMDYVATLAFLNGAGDKLATREYRAPSFVSGRAIADELMADVKIALEQQPTLQISIVQDGAIELWLALRHALDAIGVTTWHEVLDWFHTSERLAACAQLASTAAPHQTQLRQGWERLLLDYPDGGQRCIRALHGFARRLPTDAAKTAMAEHLAYFKSRRAQLAYCTMRQRNLPIGSGITEGACKSLIATRAKRGGQQWKQRGLSAALHLRSLVQSDRFDSYWSIFAARYIATSITPVSARA